MSLLAAPIYDEAGVTHIVAVGTNARLSQAGDWTFPLPPNDSAEGAFIGEFIAQDLRGATATLYYVIDEYGRSLRDGVLAELDRRGITVLAQAAVHPSRSCPGADNPNPYESTVVNTLNHGVPDVAVIVGWLPQTICIVRALYERAPGIRFVVGDGVPSDENLRSALGPAVHSLYLVRFWHPDKRDQKSQRFRDEFRRIAGRLPYQSEAMEYDGLMLLASAVQAVGPDRRAVRDYLTTLGDTRPSYRGVTGEIAFRGARRFQLLMTRASDGAIVSPEVK